MAEPINHDVTEYWSAFYVTTTPGISLCSLCGNVGIIDTRPTAFSPTGARVGRLNYCICPNGQHVRARFPEGHVPTLS